MAGCLHDHVAFETEEVTQRPELFLRRIARCVLALRGVREYIAGPKNVAMRIDRARRGAERRPRRVRMKDEPSGIHREAIRGHATSLALSAVDRVADRCAEH